MGDIVKFLTEHFNTNGRVMGHLLIMVEADDAG